jgi:hypothetical protein
VEDSNGSVKASVIHGPASVRTSFGSVNLSDIQGSVEVADQNATVEVSGVAQKNSASPCNRINVQTSFAPIRIRLPENASYDLTAHTSLGRINSELPYTATGMLSGDSLSGKINGGGCELQLNDNNGSIEILKGDAVKR